MAIGGDYHSPEKDYIRTHLWDLAFVDLIERQGRAKDAVVVLDLPGAECLYLKHLVKRFGVAKTNIVAAEQHEEPFLAIHAYLEGSGSVFHGLIEDVCERGQIASYFPIDVINLDFCGQGFVFPDPTKHDLKRSEYQRRWNSIKYVIEHNRKHEKKCWYLLLTLACAQHLNNKAGREYLRGQLADLIRDTGIEKKHAGWKDDRLIQEVVPRVIADEALEYEYAPSAEHFDSYRYVQTGHEYEMVAWRFRFDLLTSKALGGKTARRKGLLDGFCKAYFGNDAKELVL